ncbi:PA2778 family cysteine peptidase [Oceanisphaera sp. W20_SRM_FM3]|uniref:PA2778 family cysteine peptidase n=1 Tax=Oceanisphaera sp. W20_SRM_FM3 TaxID=3240267 RepID=UPI003F9BCFC3
MAHFSRLKNVRLTGVFLLLSLSLLSGCAATPQLSAAAKAQLPKQSYIPNVPFYSQRDYQCGPASLAMALGASGQQVSVDTLIPQVFLPGREGSVQPEMLAAVRRHQRISYPLNGSFDALLSEVNAGHPVVVLQNLSLAFYPLWHYAVVIGYDQEAQQLRLHSGEQAHSVISSSRFNATWARSNHWAMVALKPGQLPVSVSNTAAADSIAAFEKVAGAKAALPAWQAVTERWPDYALGWFALGNALHGDGKPDAAADAFKQATQADATLAAAWLNLGLTQQGLGERQAARTSLQKAAALPGKWQAQAKQALADHPQ